MQDSKLKPSNEPDDSGQSENIRRRLGNWATQPQGTRPMPAGTMELIQPGAGVTAPMPQTTAPTLHLTTATVPLAAAPSAPDQGTIPLAQPQQTARLSMPTAPIVQQTAPMPTTPTPMMAETVPFVQQTAPMPSAPTPMMAETVPFAQQTAPMPTAPTSMMAETVPFAQQTAPMPTAPTPMMAETVPFAQQTAPMPTAPTPMMAETVPFAQQTAPTNGFATAPMGQAPITSNGQDATLPFAAGVTASIENDVSAADDSTMPIGTNDSTATFDGPGDYTLALTGGRSTTEFELEREINILRERCSRDPSDADSLFELALALNEMGNRVEAEACLFRLVALYDQMGDAAQATRIRAMLGEGSTHPMAGPNDQTQRMSNQATDAFKPRTGTLNLKPGSVRDGRVAAKVKTDEREEPVFRASGIVFYEELPGLERLSSAAQTFWDASEADRARGRYRSASDSLMMAIATDPTVPALYLRLAELQLKLGYRRKALASVATLQQFETLFRSGVPAWVFARLRIHAEPFDLEKVQRMVDGLVADGKPEIVAPYAARLVEQLLSKGDNEGAATYANRICALAPGNTEMALEAAVLELRADDRKRARERWEFALRNGADQAVAKASLAAMIADSAEVEHWKLLADILPRYRSGSNPLLRDAYRRSAAALGGSPVTKAGEALFFAKATDPRVRGPLAAAAGDRKGSPIGRAAAAGVLARILQQDGRGDEYLASIRTTLSLFTDADVPTNVNWAGLLGFEPSVVDMSYELGQELNRAGDYAGAVEVLRQGYQLDKSNTPLNLALADAYSKTNQLGSALTILDELAMAHRKAGRLEEMASVLRQMSQLAPANAKVKTRLVDAYIQRGFVAEARAELIQLADLEEASGNKKKAITNLQRAADLSWSLGYPQEAFNLYDRILALDPEDVGNRSALVNLFLQVGRLSDAAEHQRVVVDLAIKHGRKHEAVAALHQVIGLTPDDMTAYYQLADELTSMGEYHQAEKVYKRIVLMNPDDAVAQAKVTAMAALREQMTTRTD